MFDIIGQVIIGVVALAAVFLAGKRQAAKEQRAEGHNRAVATQKRIEDAFANRDDSPSAARDRLRDRAQR